MPARDYASTRFSALDEITPATSSSSGWPGRSRPASCAATRRRRSWSATRCTSSRRSRTSLYALDLTQPGAPVKWKYDPTPRGRRAGRRLLRRGQPRRGVRRRHDLLQHARRPHHRRRRRRPASELWDASSATSTSGETITMAPLVVQGTRCWSATAAASSACAAGSPRSTRRPARSRGAPTAPARHRRADRPALQALLPAGPGQGPRRHHLAAGRVEDRRRHGVGLDLLRPRART